MSKANIRSLRNSGLLLLNGSEADPPQRTFVVLGVARGGTSMIAKALHDLGIPMGEKLSAVYEDVAVSRAMEADDLDETRRVIAQRNAAHPCWGFKRPAAVRFIKRFEAELRNPYYVVVFRDIFAVANRNRISAEQDVLKGLANAAQDNVELANLVSALQRPALLVSYEKAVAAPAAFVADLAAFAGVDAEDLVGTATKGIMPGGAEYLEQSRVKRSIGRLERVAGDTVTGWAMVTGQTEPVEVRFRVNGTRVGTLKADRPRTDLKRQALPPGGLCGFEFKLPQAAVAGDRIRARVVGEIKDLANSPFTVPQPSKARG